MEGPVGVLADDGAVEKLVLDGRVVLSIDVRGFGETAEKPTKEEYFPGGIEAPKGAVDSRIVLRLTDE